MTDNYDVVMVGAGHNGLICATYLARAGKKVLVLEANASPGGCAATRRLQEEARKWATARRIGIRGGHF